MDNAYPNLPQNQVNQMHRDAVIAVTASLSLSALSNSSISNHSSGFMLLLEKVQSSKNAIKNMSNPHRCWILISSSTISRYL
jgi:hypothetical protein